MGSTFLGESPSGALAGTVMTHASAATNAGSALVGNIGPGVWRAPQDITIVSAWHEPTGADQDLGDAASYRMFQLMDGSVNGLGTRVLASLAATASQGSNTTRAIPTITNPSVARGNVVYGQYGATVGGTHAGTVVRAGQFGFSYRPI